MIITRQCPLCGELSSVMCEEDAWESYQHGALAQVAFPEMDIFARETLISGMCFECQTRFFIEDEEEEECDGECDVCTDYDCPGNVSLFAPLFD